ncbi:hypothetical protein, partial [Klebsiella pneumoniae]|uniref:hypothetical protein n=1 Tax=Klebsiella pneumoniae TaxID=573 RepID=UPI001BA8D743
IYASFNIAVCPGITPFLPKMLRWPAALAMSGFAQDLAPERSSTSFVLSAIMRVKQTKGSPRCDLL